MKVTITILLSEVVTRMSSIVEFMFKVRDYCLFDNLSTSGSSFYRISSHFKVCTTFLFTDYKNNCIK